MQTIATNILNENNIDFVIKPHSKKVYTCEEAAAERGVRVEQIVKCMIVKNPDNTFVIALIPGDKQLDLKIFAKILGFKKISIASRDEVLKITGYPVGAISPIGIKKKDIGLYMDEAVKLEEYVDISSGRPDAGIELKSTDLIRLLDPEIVNIT
jgi:Cys-tRNA(Pro) deacylase